MWIKIEALLCCVIATSLAATEPRPKKKDEDRGKRNVDLSLAHHYPVIPSYRIERRIATSGARYPALFFPIQKPYSSYASKKGRTSIPPYAVQMEPLIHYSQRDPLFDANGLTFIGDASNDLHAKGDQINEHSHPNTQYTQYGPPKHIVERPIYIKEPEPIIEIIIKESNITLPPEPTPPLPTVGPRKKEPVQVFYVKYKKNPNGYGKDSIVYDTPIPALSPDVPDEPPQVEPPSEPIYGPPLEATAAPPIPSTTLRAIVKPESDVHHGQREIHVTFTKTINENYKRSNKPDDDKEESAPIPQITNAHTHGSSRQLPSQERQFPSQSPSPNHRPPPYQQSPPNFNSGNYRQYQSRYPSFEQPPPPPPAASSPFAQSSRVPNFFPPLPQQYNSVPPPPPSTNFHSQQSIRQPSPHFQTFPDIQPQPSTAFNQPRQPVPYQPFDQRRPISQESQGPQIQFPRTHFPIPQQAHHQQQLPQLQSAHGFNGLPPQEQKHLQATHHQFQNNLRNEEILRNQHLQQQKPQEQQFQQFQSQYLQNHQIQHPRPQSQPNFANIPKPQQEFVNQQQPNFSPPRQPSFPQTPQFPSSQFQHQANQHATPQQNNFQQPTQQFRYNNQPQNNQFNAQPQQTPQAAVNIPPGGQLIQSLPKYEQHLAFAPNGQQLSSEQQELFLKQQAQPPQVQKHQAQQHQHQPQQVHDQPVQHQQVRHQQVQQQYQFSQQVQQHQQHQSPVEVQHSSPSQNHNRHPQNAFASHNQIQNFSPTLPPVYQTTKPNFNYNPQSSQSNYISQSPQTLKTSPQYSTTPSYVREQAEQTPSTPQPPKKEEKKKFEIQLPDEVPDDLRAQLLSSGILDNADISVLDYDKVGDIPLSALPPDQLANFFNAGGGQQIAAGSEPVPNTVTKEGKVVSREQEEEEDTAIEASDNNEVKVEPPMEMKVVRFDPQTAEGQEVQDSYVQEGATQVDPVVLNDQQYNRYLPLKVNGAEFPIPDVPELKGRNITSVVVLAPVDYGYQEEKRQKRDVGENSKNSRFVASQALQRLMKEPTSTNFKKWLEAENGTAAEKQAVVLLVAEEQNKEKEIFMYDISTKSVSKLSGDLSSAFVEAAETNAQDSPVSEPTNRIENKTPYEYHKDEIDRKDTIPRDLSESPSEYYETKTSVDDIMLAEASEQFESVEIPPGVTKFGDLQVDSNNLSADGSLVSISSGYSKTGSNV